MLPTTALTRWAISHRVTRNLALRPFVAHPDAFDAEEFAALATLPRHPKSLLRALVAGRHVNVGDLVRDAHVPVTLVTGERDGLSTRRSQRSLAAEASVRAATEVPDCGHWAPLEQPDVIAQAILDAASDA